MQKSTGKKSPRNKTIDFPADSPEGKRLLEHCVTEQDFLKNGCSALTNRLIHGDSFALLTKLPAGFANLIIADPPYNLTKQYASTAFTEKSAETYRTYTKSWIDLVLPLLAADGSLYICCDWKSSIVIADVLSEYERSGSLFLRNRITWEREKGRGAGANWKNSMEDIWFVTRSERYTFNTDAVRMRRRVIAPYRQDGSPKDWVDDGKGGYRDTCPSNFWNDISIPFWSMPENTAHPTQKSEKLLAKLILASSRPGELVFDPFAGSGSTLVTAEKLGRAWCGIEREAQFCAWAQYRLERAKTDKTIQGFEDGIFHARNS
ncbi:MAG: site-specific DNA-methyltransferase [Treponema sp.]|nr:site-specific DNA-methyltransferase [Treponema sp.]